MYTGGCWFHNRLQFLLNHPTHQPLGSCSQSHWLLHSWWEESCGTHWTFMWKSLSQWLGNTVKCLPLSWSHQLPRKVIFSPTDFSVLFSHQWIWLADILQGKILGETVCTFGSIVKLYSSVCSSRLWEQNLDQMLVTLKLWKSLF